MKPINNVNSSKPIRAILYRRLKIWLIVGWIIASLGILVTTAFQVIESISGRSNHTAQMMLAFAANQDLSSTIFIKPLPAIQSTFRHYGVEDYFAVIIQDNKVRYSSIDVPPAELLALPLGSKVELQGQRWKIFGASTPQNNTRVIIGVWKWEAINAAIGPTIIVALIVLIFASLSLYITAKATKGVVEPLEDLTLALEARGQDNLSPIQTNTDIEELCKIETALNQLIGGLDQSMQRERQFIFNAAHELRTPLAAIRAQIEAIDTSAKAPLDQDQLQGVLKASDRATRLVGQMLDLARSEILSTQSSSDQSVNLVGLTQEVIAELIPQTTRQGGEIELLCPRELLCPGKLVQQRAIMLPGNYDLLYSMVRNLVENAVRYGTAPAKVLVTIEQEESGAVTLSVEDNGPGLDDGQFEIAFKKFERLGRKSGGGVGLGLSIVGQISKRAGIVLSKQEATELGGLKLVARFPEDPSSKQSTP